MNKKKHINNVITTINKKIILKRKLKEAKTQKDDAMVSFYQKQIQEINEKLASRPLIKT
jgi:hypothetical protein|tara:strand:- start:588 stop:764 length:177 start_codon:yes stop_codon:yes gene_type:complete